MARLAGDDLGHHLALGHDALCASIGSPTTSPMAQTFFTDVRHWSSTDGTAGNHVHRHGLQAPAPGPRPAPDRAKHLVGG